MDCPSGWFLRRKKRRDKFGGPDGSLGRSVSRRLRPRWGMTTGANRDILLLIWNHMEGRSPWKIILSPI